MQGLSKCMSLELARITRWQSYREHEKQRTEKACAGTADLTHSARRLGSHAHRSVQSAASTNACQQNNTAPGLGRRH